MPHFGHCCHYGRVFDDICNNHPEESTILLEPLFTKYVDITANAVFTAVHEQYEDILGSVTIQILFAQRDKQQQGAVINTGDSVCITPFESDFDGPIHPVPSHNTKFCGLTADTHFDGEGCPLAHFG